MKTKLSTQIIHKTPSFAPCVLEITQAWLPSYNVKRGLSHTIDYMLLHHKQVQNTGAPRHLLEIIIMHS